MVASRRDPAAYGYNALSGLDCMFYAFEEDTTPQGVMVTMVCDQRTMGRPFDVQEVVDHIMRRCAGVEFMYKAAVPTPLGRGAWKLVTELRPEDHVRVEVEAGPITNERLDQLMASHLRSGFTPGRPPWDFVILHSPQDHRFVVSARIHHALADGTLMVQLGFSLLDFTPEVTDLGADPVIPESVLERRKAGVVDEPALLRTVSWNEKRRKTARLIPVARELLAAMSARRALRAAADPVLVPERSAKAAPWRNVPSAGEYCVASVRLAAADVQFVRQQLGITFNSAVFALMAGGMRRYLIEQGQEPTAPIVAGCPVSTRTDAEFLAGGNQVGDFAAALPVHLADPVERAHATAKALEFGKSVYYAADPKLQGKVMDYVPYNSAVWLFRLYSRFRLARFFPFPFDTYVESLSFDGAAGYISGAEIVDLYGVPCLNQLMHVDMVAVTWGQTVYCSLVSDRPAIATPEVITDGMVEELRVLLDHFGSRPADEPAAG